MKLTTTLFTVTAAAGLLSLSLAGFAADMKMKPEMMQSSAMESMPMEKEKMAGEKMDDKMQSKEMAGEKMDDKLKSQGMAETSMKGGPAMEMKSTGEQAGMKKAM